MAAAQRLLIIGTSSARAGGSSATLPADRLRDLDDFLDDDDDDGFKSDCYRHDVELTTFGVWHHRSRPPSAASSSCSSSTFAAAPPQPLPRRNTFPHRRPLHPRDSAPPATASSAFLSSSSSSPPSAASPHHGRSASLVTLLPSSTTRPRPARLSSSPSLACLRGMTTEQRRELADKIWREFW
ncbi:hypothetical protein CDD83_7791 [Cordyceps sp. RAO-2017]|nr:hypothetical protein CDD83_7791 [Cordyceps sp. RAO-2017]